VNRAAGVSTLRASILAGEDLPGNILGCKRRTPEGSIPLWGQSGSFEITVGAMRVRIEMEGIYGLGSFHMAWPGFAAHAVDFEKPFLSETGYRSFLAIGGDLRAGFTPDSFAHEIIAAHVKRHLGGKLLAIGPKYRHAGAEGAS
jgi:hypothetical protein